MYDLTTAPDGAQRKGQAMDLRQIILDAMKKQGMSQYRLAKLSGVSQQTVNRFCRGERDLTSQRVEKLLAALSLRIDPD
jgi:transcriptional regulator with XRE-family HTH domain